MHQRLHFQRIGGTAKRVDGTNSETNPNLHHHRRRHLSRHPSRRHHPLHRRSNHLHRRPNRRLLPKILLRDLHLTRRHLLHRRRFERGAGNT